MAANVNANIMAQTDGDYLVLRPDSNTLNNVQKIQSKIAQIMADNGIQTYHSTPAESIHLTLFNHLNGPGADATHSYGLTPTDRAKLMNKVAEKVASISPFVLTLTLGKKTGGRPEVGIDAGSNLSFPLNLGVRLTLDTKNLELLRSKVCEAVKESGITIDQSKLNPKGVSHVTHELTKNFHPHFSLGTLDLESDQSHHRDVQKLNDKQAVKNQSGQVQYNSDGSVKTYRKIEREIRRQLFSSPSYGGMSGLALPFQIDNIELLGSNRLVSHDETQKKKPSRRSNTQLSQIALGKRRDPMGTITHGMAGISLGSSQETFRSRITNSVYEVKDIDQKPHQMIKREIQKAVGPTSAVIHHRCSDSNGKYTVRICFSDKETAEKALKVVDPANISVPHYNSNSSQYPWYVNIGVGRSKILFGTERGEQVYQAAKKLDGR